MKTFEIIYRGFSGKTYAERFDAETEEAAYEMWADKAGYLDWQDACDEYAKLDRLMPTCLIVAEDLPCTTCTVMVGSHHAFPCRAVRVGIPGQR